MLVAQWVDGNRDRNVSCPALTGRAAGPHPLTRWAGSRLHLGSRGPAVRALQRALGMTVVDGVFGPRTRARLQAFQRSAGLGPTGVTGRYAWRALGAGTVLPEQPSRLPELFTPY